MSKRLKGDRKKAWVKHRCHNVASQNVHPPIQQKQMKWRVRARKGEEKRNPVNKESQSIPAALPQAK